MEAEHDREADWPTARRRPGVRPSVGPATPSHTGGADLLLRGNVSSDPRGRKIAVVADARLDALLPDLQARGYGAIQLPPAGLDPELVTAWLEQVAEHLAEFLRNDYEVALAGDGSNEEELRAKLAELGVVDALTQYAIQPPSTSRLTPET